jgi:uncharacterized protein
MSGAPFIDRAEERDALARLAARPRPALILVYGRRRVGKTFLLDHAFRDHRLFYYLATDATAALNRQELLRELALWSGRELDPTDYPTWRTVFRLLVDLATDSPLVVVLDEFQYLLNRPEDDVASQLVAVWDREVRDRPLTLALSGSEIATMARLADGSQPLYGRFDYRAHLLPFDYLDTRAMMPARPPRVAAYFYGVLGGTPRYLAAVEPDESLDTAVTRVMVNPSGEVHLQVAQVITQEGGIRDPAAYQSVLAAVASGATQLHPIAERAGVDDRAAARILEVLEGLELVGRERNFAAPARAPYRYHIADHAVRFWYAFVDANRSRLVRPGGARSVWEGQIAPSLDTYMGKVFEGVCQQAYRRHHRRWALPDADEWARWEGQDRNRRPIEIDLVARLDDGRILTGEIKWSSQPVDIGIHHALTRDLEDLGRSGQGWAHAALAGPRLYYSAAGFSERFRELAAREGDLYLVTLEDMYREIDAVPGSIREMTHER